MTVADPPPLSPAEITERVEIVVGFLLRKMGNSRRRHGGVLREGYHVAQGTLDADTETPRRFMMTVEVRNLCSCPSQREFPHSRFMHPDINDTPPCIVAGMWKIAGAGAPRRFTTDAPSKLSEQFAMEAL